MKPLKKTGLEGRRLRVLCAFCCATLLFFFGLHGDPIEAGESGSWRVSTANTAIERVIVAFGDSLTAGLGLPVDEAYPAILENRLVKARYAYRVVNAGVSGDTTAGGLRRINWVLRNKPDLVILELGANDGLRGLDVDEIKKNLSKIIARLQAERVEVVLAGMKMPLNYGKSYTEAFEQIYRDLAEHYQITLIPFFLEGVAARPRLNQADGIHPTAKGYRIIVDRIWDIIEPLLINESLNKP
jgi:acyl-CoA thioesterase-1